MQVPQAFFYRRVLNLGRMIFLALAALASTGHARASFKQSLGDDQESLAANLLSLFPSPVKTHEHAQEVRNRVSRLAPQRRSRVESWESPDSVRQRPPQGENSQDNGRGASTRLKKRAKSENSKGGGWSASDPEDFGYRDSGSGNGGYRTQRRSQSEDSRASRGGWSVSDAEDFGYREDGSGNGGYRKPRRSQSEDSRSSRWDSNSGGYRPQRGSKDRNSRDDSGYQTEQRRPNRRFDRVRTESEVDTYDGDSIYGISPALLALRSKRREFHKLYIQDTLAHGGSDRKEVDEIRRLAGELGVEIETREKGFLNSLSENRPHQGIVLQATHLEFEDMDSLPRAVDSGDQQRAPVWLALDMVTDPQNLGSLLRSAFFLGVDGVFLSRKNSCPLTPVVSKASSGASEIMPVHAVRNLVKVLELAKDDGWQVLGAELESDKSIRASEADTTAPTVLVLGSEGHGLRTNILKACSSRVAIPRGTSALGTHADARLIDSLNVGVAGGVLLHSLLNARAIEKQ